MRLCLVEDHAVCQLEPLTLTRPVHELLLGGITLESKISRALGVGPGPQRRSCLIRSHLVDVQRHRVPHMVVNDRDWLARSPVIVAKGRWVPPVGFGLPDSYG
jgi:UDP-N-acetylglucosamine diphosphorylase / glucose-1-phosphate thymidylyltransferase / UDP-N-acetylgalactosamine diphosphorylase / glucosamine-1-phosphate N-acetyltransferase / galactosamine-1-phosphate N-acetyltransferase